MDDGSDLASQVRNSILAFVVALILLLAFTAYFFSYQTASQRASDTVDDVSEMIAYSLFEPFLSANFTTLNTATDQLVTRREDFGIAYMAVLDDQGNFVLSSVHEDVSPGDRSMLEEERFVDTEGLVIESREDIQGEDLDVREIVLPVTADGTVYGGLMIGIDREFLWRHWYSTVNQLALGTAVLLVIAVLVVLFLQRRWEDLITNRISLARSEITNQYEEKLERAKEETSTGPLTPDEYFELIDYAKRVGETLDPEALLKYMVNSVYNMLQVRQTMVFLVSTDNPDQLVGQMGLEEDQWMERDRLQNLTVDIGSGEVGTVAELGQANIIDRPRKGAGVAAAIRSRGKTIGVIRATEKETGEELGNADKLKLRLVAQMTGDLLYNAFQIAQGESELGESG